MKNEDLLIEERGLRLYRQFMAEGDSEEMLQVFEGKNRPSVLGSKGFMDSPKERFFSKKRHREIPESTILSPDKERINRLVISTG